MRRLLVLGILLAVTPALAKTSQGHSRTVQLARTAWRPGTFDIYFVPAADNIVAALEQTIGDKIVTYDFARLMEGATEVKCSAFAQAIVDRL